MGRRPAGEPPKYRQHASGQAFSRLNGKDKYFGVYGTPASHAAYQDFVADWRRQQAPIVVKASRTGTLQSAVDQFLAAHKPPRYSDTEYTDISRDLAALTERYGGLSPSALRPTHIKAVRQGWVDAGNKRRTVNRRVQRLRRFFRWAVGEELIRPDALAIIEHLAPLRKGEAPDSPPIEPVPWEDWVSTLRHLPPRVRAMSIVLLFSGPRVSEVCRMRGEEIVRGGTLRMGSRTLTIPPGVWLFVPGRTKTDHLEGLRIVYFLGPRVQAALRPWLRDGFLFSPREAADEEHAARRKPTSRYVRVAAPKLAPGDHYTTFSYRQAVTRVCEAHGIEPWTPAQLRHNFVSRMDAVADLVTASAAVGHKSLNTSLIYLQRKLHDVAPIMSRRG